MEYKFNNGVCCFVGDWENLKSLGFRYVKHDRIAYFYEGLSQEFKYSNTVIHKSKGIVQTSKLTRCLYHVFEFITEDLDGIVPESLYIDFEKGIISKHYKLHKYSPPIYLKGEGIEVLYRMYLEGSIVHDPEIKILD